jgi:hypothetical protein
MKQIGRDLWCSRGEIIEKYIEISDGDISKERIPLRYLHVNCRVISEFTFEG